MKKMNKYLISSVMLLGGLTACTDNWNEHYNIDQATVQRTLWEQIEADPELSDFAEILDSAYYYTSPTKRSSMKYSELLSQNSKYTVWAPKNNTFDKEYWLKECKNDPYNMQQRFIKNHMNLFSKAIGGAEIDSMTMLNGKMYLLDNSIPKLKDSEITKTIGARNGIIYVISDTVPFLSNVYEYIQLSTETPQLTAYFEDYDTTYFDANLSTQGPIIDGQVTYVDSVTYTTNNLFSYAFDDNGNTRNGVGAPLNSEDSLYVMVLPTDDAWKEAESIIKPYFNYLTEYKNKVDKEGKNTMVNKDSMQVAQTEMSIVNNLVFSVNTQGGDLESFHKRDSIVTTTHVKMPYAVSLFGGNKDNYIPLSNGYAYLVDHFAYQPANSFKPDIELEGESKGYIAWYDYMSSLMGTKEEADPKCVTQNVVKSQLNDTIKGTISGDSYIVIKQPTKYDPAIVSYCLPDVLSGTYDIKVVMLPNNIMNKNAQGKQTLFYAQLSYYDENGKEQTFPRNLYEKEFKNNLSQVDTIPLFENFKFPVAYKGVSKAYPILSLESTEGSDFVSGDMYIDKIILVSKDEN